MIWSRNYTFWETKDNNDKERYEWGKSKGEETDVLKTHHIPAWNWAYVIQNNKNLKDKVFLYFN